MRFRVCWDKKFDPRAPGGALKLVTKVRFQNATPYSNNIKLK